MAVRCICLVLLGAGCMAASLRQSELLKNIHQISPVRNFIIFTESHAVQALIKPFHQSQPVVIVDLTQQRRSENYNTTFRRTLENYLCNYKNVYFTFLLHPEHFAKAFDRIASFTFWKARQINIIVANFTMDQVRACSQWAFQKYWATNLIFTQRDFRLLMRYVQSEIACANFEDSQTPQLSNTPCFRFDPFRNATTTEQSASLIFQNPTSNLQGYRLKIAMIPSITAKWNGSHFNGRDGILMTEILRQFNATAEFRRFSVAEYGEFSSGSLTGIMAYVANGSVDANFNSRFMSREVARYVDNTFPHEMDNLIILLPIHLSASSSVWIVESVEILVAAIIVLMLTLLFLHQHLKLPYSLLPILAVQLMTGRAINLPSSPLTNIVLMSTSFFMFFLISTFQCRLISVLTITSGSSELTRIQEAANTGYSFNTEKIFRTALENFEGSDTQSMKKIMSRNHFYETEELLGKFSKCSKSEAFITTGKGAHALFQGFKGGQGCFYKLKAHLNPVQLTFVLKYGSPLLGKVNVIILRTFESGLQRVWGQSAPSQVDMDGEKVIKFENLKTQFNCLWAGWILGFLVLLVEIAMKYWRNVA
ncbi:hypothetical protein HUJ05_005481 [Dendroctonus ponderosae]|nr:hypothetical protein HUJ05_005481 [Dendroctonus ponderosae]